eukprot:TRINITY_DN20923_c0_g1_i1.p1 TRINITY_DN20923_c0_g1~~TRINITY_DN20923_c0_g1_i1.p1  ORF type:complete len:129 (+),score=23.77 TRINITY_DN20923_c0_g1_i1:75-461(+)
MNRLHCLPCARALGFFFQAEDGIRDLVRSRGLGDVYKRQLETTPQKLTWSALGPPSVEPKSLRHFLFRPGREAPSVWTQHLDWQRPRNQHPNLRGGRTEWQCADPAHKVDQQAGYAIALGARTRAEQQ